MALTLDGVVSGLDTTSLIGSLVGVAKIPKLSLEADQDAFEAQLDKVTEFKGLLSDLQDTMEALADPDTFGEYSVAQSDADPFTASVSNSATPGTYEIEVNQLAQAEMEVSQSFADSTTAGVLSTGTMDVTIAGTATTVTIDATSTLSSLADDLDAISGLSAFVMDTGDATTPYKLVVMADDTGTSNTVSFDTSLLTGVGTVPSFTEQVSAQDAEVTLNGITVTNEDNTIADIVPGLDLDLTQTTTSAVSVTVNRDDDAIIEKIEGFVSAYNDLRTMYGASTDFDSAKGIKGALFGEGTTRGIMDTLSGRVSLTAGTSTSGLDMSFSLLGINTKQNGNLELDTDTLQGMLDSDYDFVIETFSASDGPAADMITLMDETYLSTDGFLKTKEDSLEGTIEDLEDTIDAFDTRLEAYEERLRDKFTSMEVILGQLQATTSYLGALLAT